MIGGVHYFHLTSFPLSGVQYCQINVAFSIQTYIFYLFLVNQRTKRKTVFPEFGVRNDFPKTNASQDSPEKHCPSPHCSFKQCLFLCASLLKGRAHVSSQSFWALLVWVTLWGFLLHSVWQRWLDLPSKRETELILIYMVRLHNEYLTWPVLMYFMVTSGLHSLLPCSFTGLSIW